MKDEASPGVEKINPGNIRRRALTLTRGGLVAVETQRGERELPLVMRPSVEGVDLTAWASSNREFIMTHLLKHGGILFRNFGVSSVEEFERLVTACSAEPLQYRERSSPRTPVNNNIYTSTDYPADQSIFLHNENSYQHVWPMKIFFICLEAPEQGGETPIADCRKVYERIDPKIRGRFIEKGWMLVRNFGGGMSLTWQSVFQTEDKSAVEAYCRQAGIETEWRGDRLRTRQARPAVARHPATGEMVWFNHAAFFHVTTLAPSTREVMLSSFEEEELPNNTYYGDGSPIEPSVLEEIREAYGREAVSFPWREREVLLLDNMLVAHGRRPYTGRRKILVAMAEPFGPIAATIR
jgi:alpha-ketoglutarate-dependent taurine dioxygenase